MSNYAVIILNRYPDFAANLIESIRKTHKELPKICIVRDRHKESFGPDIDYIDGIEPFIFSRNANLGITKYPNLHIVLCNDDTTCFLPEFFHNLNSKGVLMAEADVGILSPLIDGGVGNDLQRYPEVRLYWDKAKQAGADCISSGGTICFPCVWLNREMIDQIGLLDENMVGYGEDDTDYCIRARHHKWLCAVTNWLVIRHGTGGVGLDRGKNWSCSFARNADVKSNRQILLDKYSNQNNA